MTKRGSNAARGIIAYRVGQDTGYTPPPRTYVKGLKTVACPDCGAPIGQQCVAYTTPDRKPVVTHPSRRRIALRAQRDDTTRHTSPES